jgi:hypothetical protein
MPDNALIEDGIQREGNSILRLASITPFFFLFISTRHTCDAMIHVALHTGFPGSTLVDALE